MIILKWAVKYDGSLWTEFIFIVLVGTPEGKKRLENLDVYIYIYIYMIILKWAVKYDGSLWTEFIFIS